MAAETHINVGFRDALLRVSGWNPSDVAADDQAAGVSFYGRRIKPDVLLTLPSHPPLLVECKVHSSSGDPLKDVSEKLGAAPLSPDAPRAAGETVSPGHCGALPARCGGVGGLLWTADRPLQAPGWPRWPVRA